jgi:nucleosome binding factor SPN SPT16 subunit
LLGYEFPQTLFIITQDGITIVTTKKKASFLEKLKNGKVPLEVVVRGKDADENAKQVEQCLDIVKKAGVCILTCDSMVRTNAHHRRK